MIKYTLEIDGDFITFIGAANTLQDGVRISYRKGAIKDIVTRDIDNNLTIIDIDDNSAAYNYKEVENPSTIGIVFIDLTTFKNYIITNSIVTTGSSGVGDMILASVQSVSGLKTFDKDKLAMSGTSTGSTTLSTANTGSSNFTATLPAKTITIAGLSDIPDVSALAPKNNPIFTGVVTSPAFSGRKNPRIQSVISSSTATPNADTDDVLDITALATNITFNNPSGSPVNKQVITIDIMPDSTPRNLVFSSTSGGYISGGVALPTITISLKMMSLIFVYDSVAIKWKLRSLAQE